MFRKEWFVSDPHLGHKNTLNFISSRGARFKNITELNEAFFDTWDETVGRNDVVWVLGDLIWNNVSGNKEQLSKLPGSKRLVLGNHDSSNMGVYKGVFGNIYGAKKWNNVILTHIPVHPECLGNRFLLNAHGHIHDNNIMINSIPDSRYFNVCWDRIGGNFSFVEDDELLEASNYVEEMQAELN